MPELGKIGSTRVVALAQLPDGTYAFAGVNHKGEGVAGRLATLEDTEWMAGQYFEKPARALAWFAGTVSAQYGVADVPAAPEPQEAPASTYLTPADTYSVFVDAVEGLHQWGDVEWGTSPVGSWSVVVTEDDGDGRATLDHETLIKAMREMVAVNDTLKLKSVGHYAKALAAASNDEATDHIRQADVHGFDSLVQWAVFGEIKYIY